MHLDYLPLRSLSECGHRLENVSLFTLSKLFSSKRLFTTIFSTCKYTFYLFIYFPFSSQIRVSNMESVLNYVLSCIWIYILLLNMLRTFFCLLLDPSEPKLLSNLCYSFITRYFPFYLFNLKHF